ncbi:hypothetical protein HanIR_Chr11g0547651 [Helianthus annuus]|nr:hypothetical protein HanIR_Chr11g0547651 [Helianthus annuus]
MNLKPSPNVVEYNFMDLKSSPPRHTSYANDSEPLMKEIPSIFHPYISRIKMSIPMVIVGFDLSLWGWRWMKTYGVLFEVNLYKRWTLTQKN